jgi:hypothetical protein
MIIGKVTMVEYNQLRARLLHSVKCSSTSIKGKIYHIGNIGSYVKIKNHINDDIICEVIAIQETERYSKQTITDASFDLDSIRELILRPIGILTRKGKTTSFSLGVSVYPSIYSDVYIVIQEDLNAILTGQEDEREDNSSIGSIRLGISKSLVDYPVRIEIDKFFNIHSAVLGNSGSGKSYTIAHILQSVLEKNTPGARFILFDTNGEYPSAFRNDGGNYTHVHYKPVGTESQEDTEGYKPFSLPYYLLNLDEWLAFLMASDRTQRPFWDQVLQECYRFHQIAGDNNSSRKFYNYIKWKVYRILLILSVRPGGDTGNMTDAISILSSIESLIKDKNREENELKDLHIFFAHCKKICTFHYASNNGKLIASLPLFTSGRNTETSPMPVGIMPREEGRLTYYEATLVSKASDNTFTQINENEAEEVSKTKLEYGQYFEHSFLKIAAELVLLEEEARGNTRIREYTSTMFTRLDFFLHNRDCDFMRSGIKMTLNEYLSQTFGISTQATKNKAMSAQLITIDLSEMGNDVLELVTSVISRMIFDTRKGLPGQDRKRGPIHLVLDEAHRYIKKDGNYILRENIFERIAREGRKFAYYLLVSSQRPSELSSVVLSQCSNYIIHRIHNRVDLDFVTSVLPYFSEDYTTKIKQAVPGEALVFGNCVPMPLRVQIHKANPEPASQNCKVWEEWTSGRVEQSANKDRCPF